MEIVVRVCMENHVYQHGGKFYRQEKVMPIGLRLSGVVAELRMCDWLLEADTLMIENKLKIYMNEVYVDDEDVGSCSIKIKNTLDVCWSMF